MILLCRPELVAGSNLCDRPLDLTLLLLCSLQKTHEGQSQLGCVSVLASETACLYVCYLDNLLTQWGALAEKGKATAAKWTASFMLWDPQTGTFSNRSKPVMFMLHITCQQHGHQTPKLMTLSNRLANCKVCICLIQGLQTRRGAAAQCPTCFCSSVW